MASLAEEYLEAYGEHARTLRTWLVAYGIGAPILLITNDSFAVAIRKSGDARWMAGCFFAGVTLQVLLSAVNKSAMWGLYYGETAPLFKRTFWFKLAYGVSERYWIDFVVDLATFVLFGIATWKAVLAVIRAAVI